MRNVNILGRHIRHIPQQAMSSGKTFPFKIYDGPWTVAPGTMIEVPSGASGEMFYNIFRPLMTDQTSEVVGFKINKFRFSKTFPRMADAMLQIISADSLGYGVIPIFAKKAEDVLEPIFANLHRAAGSVRDSLDQLNTTIGRVREQKDTLARSFGAEQTSAMMAQLDAAQEALDDFALPTLTESLKVFQDVAVQARVASTPKHSATAAAVGGHRRRQANHRRTKTGSRKTAQRKRQTKTKTGSRKKRAQGKRSLGRK